MGWEKEPEVYSWLTAESVARRWLGVVDHPFTVEQLRQVVCGVEARLESEFGVGLDGDSFDPQVMVSFWQAYNFIEGSDGCFEILPGKQEDVVKTAFMFRHPVLSQDELIRLIRDVDGQVWGR